MKRHVGVQQKFAVRQASSCFSCEQDCFYALLEICPEAGSHGHHLEIGEILGDPLLLVGENYNQLAGYHMEMVHTPEGDPDSELEAAHDIHVLATMAILTATDREQRPPAC
ncbi:hypothetical protein [Paenibacillus polymyxa]|uniref:hypothetical protein n=1 Tax=Paenibacillus polymyxa TaxID=1406 RepID=UPI000845E833|nr:hypothetical protein [Paenibacillus polymyxa]AOK88396.1 hypothetical protein AOU00_00555 [Paenibacillus polymyxa]